MYTGMSGQNIYSSDYHQTYETLVHFRDFRKLQETMHTEEKVLVS